LLGAKQQFLDFRALFALYDHFSERTRLSGANRQLMDWGAPLLLAALRNVLSIVFLHREAPISIGAAGKCRPAAGHETGWSLARHVEKTVQRHGFRTNESIVYPAHGVGKIIDIEEQVVAGMKLELFVINFRRTR
jgi:hypothetical protein